MDYKLYHGDCLEIMDKLIQENIKVDAIIADIPYGKIHNSWDCIIPFDDMWGKINKIIKHESNIILFGSQPFTSKLILSNEKMYKYCLIWEKEQGSMPMNAPYQPIKVHEDIILFSNMSSTYSKKGTMNYNPQMNTGEPYKSNDRKDGNIKFHSNISKKGVFNDNNGKRYPRSVLRFKTERGLHPTQKPITLMEYLIKTYTNEKELILDFTSGSNSTGIACQNTNRNYIGIEKDDKYFEIGKNRMDKNKP